MGDSTSMTEIDLLPSLEGRLTNLGKLKRWEMAMAELVQNSIDSLGDVEKPGRIEIRLIREKALKLDEFPAPISAVEVIDTGPGFQYHNFKSFCTPDSTWKHQRGGKGIGRLTCLLAFEKLTVNSYFREDDKFLHRVAELTRSGRPRAKLETLKNEENVESRTTVRIEGLRCDHVVSSQITVHKIAEWLREHFLAFLIAKPSWLKSLTLVCEEDEQDSIDLISMVEGKERWKDSFKIGSYKFNAVCHSLVEDGKKEDKVRLVAAHRVVNSNTKGLNFYLPHLSRVVPQDGSVVLVHSDFFDLHVNSLRNAVTFESDDSEEGEEEPTLGGGVLAPVTAPAFREGFREFLNSKLRDVVSAEDELFRTEIEKVVTLSQPSYRSLLRGYFSSRYFERLKRGSSQSDILQSLDTYKRKDVEKMKKLSKSLAKKKKTSEGYDELARDLASRIDTQKQVALAEYVSLRKIILDRLENILGKEDKQHSREKDVHDLLFPMNTDTELPSEISHQLWILDERLEAHSYLASDQPIKGRNSDRPDLLIALDTPGAFGTGSAGADRYDPVILVELKRPLLANLETCGTDELPHKQLMRYAKQISDGNAEHYRTKRPINTSETTRFYLYAVCDMTQKFSERLETMEGFTLSLTGDGAFKSENRGRWYIEYISLGKLLNDARMRNSSFFRKLGLE